MNGQGATTLAGNSRIRFKSCYAYRFAGILAHRPIPILAVVLPLDAKSKMLLRDSIRFYS